MLISQLSAACGWGAAEQARGWRLGAPTGGWKAAEAAGGHPNPPCFPPGCSLAGQTGGYESDLHPSWTTANILLHSRITT